MSPTAPIPADSRRAIERRLEDVRQRTLALVSCLDFPTLRRQHLPILSPMVWDLGHIGNFEEMWLVETVGGREPLAEGYRQMFDAVANPRPTREELPLPDRRTLAEYLSRVRLAALDVLDDLASSPADPRLLADGFVYELIAEHEEQHQETILQLLQALDGPPYVPPLRRRAPGGGRRAEPETVEIPAGPYRLGHDGDGFAYDNERAAHEVEVSAFAIGRFPVSTGEYLEFVDDGGYARRELWSEEGWAWRRDEEVEAPGNWRRGEGGWEARYMDETAPLPDGRPVVHVCHHEAAAYCRWAGARLPSEAEWEKAVLGEPGSGRRRWPWGDEPPTPERANLDQLAFAPAPLGAYPEGASAFGVEQAIGDVWEWTASDFLPYPGFTAFPYPEYSEIFFGDEHRVLRGGSWATRPAVARPTSRNWDYPIRRQIFAGFRVALDL